MLKCLTVLTALLFVSAPLASAQQTRQYWMVGSAQDSEGRYITADYIDAATIVSVSPNVRRAWAWNFSAPYSSSEYAGEHGVFLREFNCGTRQYRSLQLTRYAANGEVLSSSSRVYPWDYVTPNTMAEIELNFVCASPEERNRLATRVTLGLTPNHHAAGVFAQR